MSNRRLLKLEPKNFTKKEVLDSLGNSRHFRNPFRVDLKPGFPGEGDERQKDYARMFSTQDEGFAKKGRPF